MTVSPTPTTQGQGVSSQGVDCVLGGSLLGGCDEALTGTSSATWVLLTALCSPAGLRQHPCFQNPLSWPCSVLSFIPLPLLVNASIALSANPRGILHYDFAATIACSAPSLPTEQALKTLVQSVPPAPSSRWGGPQIPPLKTSNRQQVDRTWCSGGPKEAFSRVVHRPSQMLTCK